MPVEEWELARKFVEEPKVSAFALIIAFMLRCALLSVSVGAAFRILRDPGLCSPLGRGAGRILIAGWSDKFTDSLAKNAWRSG